MSKFQYSIFEVVGHSKTTLETQTVNNNVALNINDKPFFLVADCMNPGAKAFSVYANDPKTVEIAAKIGRVFSAMTTRTETTNKDGFLLNLSNVGFHTDTNVARMFHHTLGDEVVTITRTAKELESVKENAELVARIAPRIVSTKAITPIMFHNKEIKDQKTFEDAVKDGLVGSEMLVVIKRLAVRGIKLTA